MGEAHWQAMIGRKRRCHSRNPFCRIREQPVGHPALQAAKNDRIDSQDY
jgi:hypothetical protein